MIMKMNMKVTLFFVVALFVFAHSASAQTTKVYVGNLSIDTTVDSIRSAFQSAGEVKDVQLPMDRDTGKSRGFAFVTMGSAAEATKAIAEMNGKMLDGKRLRVNEAEERGPRDGKPIAGGNQIPCEGGKLILVEGKFGSGYKCVKDPVPPAKPADKPNEPQTTPKTEPKQTEPPNENDESEDDVETVTLYVSNLSLQTTEDSLREAFEEVGEVISVEIEKDKKGKPTGVAYIEMPAEDAENAISALNGNNLDGKKIVVKKAEPIKKEKPLL